MKWIWQVSHLTLKERRCSPVRVMSAQTFRYVWWTLSDEAASRPAARVNVGRRAWSSYMGLFGQHHTLCRLHHLVFLTYDSFAVFCSYSVTTSVVQVNLHISRFSCLLPCCHNARFLCVESLQTWRCSFRTPVIGNRGKTPGVSAFTDRMYLSNFSVKLFP